ncbi:hypothetical protein FVE85_3167 [Porphyridium purpureum]|uniref:Uncharacterized protein n=1 Tax=Porphyridium purpureum TaxID=35688 RepID=A0A5J4YU94_PORPP|nr:hypothetical protein FVE85_3167 [Porphyridium purpureum]|eukprot:POR3904..scf227_4
MQRLADFCRWFRDYGRDAVIYSSSRTDTGGHLKQSNRHWRAPQAVEPTLEGTLVDQLDLPFIRAASQSCI